MSSTPNVHPDDARAEFAINLSQRLESDFASFVIRANATPADATTMFQELKDAADVVYYARNKWRYYLISKGPLAALDAFEADADKILRKVIHTLSKDHGYTAGHKNGYDTVMHRLSYAKA